MRKPCQQNAEERVRFEVDSSSTVLLFTKEGSPNDNGCSTRRIIQIGTTGDSALQRLVSVDAQRFAAGPQHAYSDADGYPDGAGPARGWTAVCHARPVPASRNSAVVRLG